MSAPRDLACPGIDKVGAVSAERGIRRRGPAQHVVADVPGVPVGVVGLHLDHHRVLEARRLKGAVPFQGRFPDRVPIPVRRRVFNPPQDRLDGFGQGPVGVLFPEIPPVDQIPIGGRAIAGLVGDPRHEVSHPGVVEPGLEIVFRHRDHRVLQARGDVAWIGDVVTQVPRRSRARVLEDIVHRERGVLRIVADPGPAGLLHAQFSEGKPLPVFSGNSD